MADITRPPEDYPAYFGTVHPRIQHNIGGGETQSIAQPASALHPYAPQFPIGKDPTLIYKVPLVSFGGDILCPAGARTIIDIAGQLGSNCVGFSVVGVTVSDVVIYVNNGGGRRLFQDVVYDDAEINNLVVSGGTAGCIVQLHGV